MNQLLNVKTVSLFSKLDFLVKPVRLGLLSSFLLASSCGWISPKTEKGNEGEELGVLSSFLLNRASGSGLLSNSLQFTNTAFCRSAPTVSVTWTDPLNGVGYDQIELTMVYANNNNSATAMSLKQKLNAGTLSASVPILNNYSGLSEQIFLTNMLLKNNASVDPMLGNYQATITVPNPDWDRGASIAHGNSPVAVVNGDKILISSSVDGSVTPNWAASAMFDILISMSAGNIQIDNNSALSRVIDLSGVSSLECIPAVNYNSITGTVLNYDLNVTSPRYFAVLGGQVVSGGTSKRHISIFQVDYNSSTSANMRYILGLVSVDVGGSWNTNAIN